jgi:hypothetical protein
MATRNHAGTQSSAARTAAVVTLDEKFSQFSEYWSPKIVGELNGQMVKLVKLEHRPVADEEVEVLLFEPASTLNTGNVKNERTREVLDRL